MKRNNGEGAYTKWDLKKLAAEYDDIATKTIPDMEHFYRAVTDALPEHSARVLELGCGTGLLTARIRRTHPDTAVTCVDNSEAMLAAARQKPELCDVTLTQGDIRDPWPDGPYDAIMSTFCLIALESDERRVLLRRAYDVLRPGGVCITGCVVRPPNAEEEQRELARWVTFMQDAGLGPDEIQRQRLSWDDTRARIPTAEGFREMIEEAGFTQIQCPYHRGLYAIFVGVR
ncbi:class I SAM-dependent methyltransferase [Methanogenium organophilum]|uniref:Methyltransferase domain-containing protein n=1 Tax=Methanogenium organophilum TaxID=2199 RepID=A0A9X9S417_METOG|nr:class I SAM-dependent methyltransferase [Methanogenium organophilum]WAI01087.1 methyltransferase domain-containing protein [Methanogenium organophilum]